MNPEHIYPISPYPYSFPPLLIRMLGSGNNAVWPFISVPSVPRPPPYLHVSAGPPHLQIEAVRPHKVGGDQSCRFQPKSNPHGFVGLTFAPKYFGSKIP